MGIADRGTSRAAAALGAVLLVGAVAAACGSGSGAYPPLGGGSGYYVGQTVPVSPAQAMIVEVDPNLTLAAEGGQGVGVFVQYNSGGHWNVSWACDTQLSGMPCAYQVNASSRGGALSNAVGSGLQAGDEVGVTSAGEVDASTTVANAIAGETFDAPAGASVELSVTLNGGTDGVTFFFVQDGQLNGGFTGTLTNPLVFEPKSP